LGLKPEELAAGTARIFLGLRLQCAQCHDHPHDRWTQQDFWGYAAFFARLQQAPQNAMRASLRLVDLADGEVTLPGTQRVVPPQYPGDLPLSQPAESGTRRRQLAIWMVSRDNPYLARTAVNRVWAHLWGRGLVDPVDDLGDHNPPIHPQLFDELTKYLVQTGFDLRELFFTLTSTQAYQLSSRPVAGTPDAPDPLLCFASMPIKTMSAEQLYDSLCRATGRRSADLEGSPRRATGLFDDARRQFVAQMASHTVHATEYESGLPQALLQMNGPLISEITDPAKGGLLASLEAPWLSDPERIDILFMATLSRLPDDEERSRLVSYVHDGAPARGSQQALSDILWALVNSAEFVLNP
jgi:hypothetical protein